MGRWGCAARSTGGASLAGGHEGKPRRAGGQERHGPALQNAGWRGEGAGQATQRGENRRGLRPRWRFHPHPKLGVGARQTRSPPAQPGAHAPGATHRPACVGRSLADTPRGFAGRRGVWGAWAVPEGGSRGAGLRPGRRLSTKPQTGPQKRDSRVHLEFSNIALWSGRVWGHGDNLRGIGVSLLRATFLDAATKLRLQADREPPREKTTNRIFSPPSRRPFSNRRPPLSRIFHGPSNGASFRPRLGVCGGADFGRPVIFYFVFSMVYRSRCHGAGATRAVADTDNNEASIKYCNCANL